MLSALLMGIFNEDPLSDLASTLINNPSVGPLMVANPLMKATP